MVTSRDDDYLICKHYYNHIDDISDDYKDFITFEHNSNYYFAWVNDGKVILRSEAYPDMERTIRGIKAIIKNRDLEDRYSIDSQHGVHFLCLWGGGKNNKHSGNFSQHNEIGRSCPSKTKEALYDLVSFKGEKFASAVTGFSAATAAVVKPLTSSGAGKGAKVKEVAKNTANKGAAAMSAAASTGTAAATTTASTTGGFKWWWLLPLLLIPAFFLFKGCGGDKVTSKAATAVKDTAVTTTKDASTELDASAVAAKAKADADAKAKADAAAAKAKADAKIKADAAAKAKRDAARKEKTGGSVSQNNITIGNKNSGF